MVLVSLLLIMVLYSRFFSAHCSSMKNGIYHHKGKHTLCHRILPCTAHRHDIFHRLRYEFLLTDSSIHCEWTAGYEYSPDPCDRPFLSLSHIPLLPLHRFLPLRPLLLRLHHRFFLSTPALLPEKCFSLFSPEVWSRYEPAEMSLSDPESHCQ